MSAPRPAALTTGVVHGSPGDPAKSGATIKVHDRPLWPGLAFTVTEIGPNGGPTSATVELTPGLVDLLQRVIVAKAWTSEGVTVLGPGQQVTRWTHPTGAIVDDNRHNLPGDLRDEPEVAADTAFVGHRPGDGGFEQFPTFAQAAAFALGEEQQA